MNILFDHVDWNSTAGPHWFARKLAEYLYKKKHGIYSAADMYQHSTYDAQLSFVIATQKIQGVPLFQRLDGIYYDTTQDYKGMNSPIQKTYKVADGVVFQSEWSKKLVESQFGPAKKYEIIHNGIDLDVVDQVSDADWDGFDKVWCCASSWFYDDGRPRYIKRLDENIRYFQEHSGNDDILCIAGDIKDYKNPDDEKIIFLGNLDISELMSLYKRADYFIHLGKFDNCPNVVIDARAFGCQIICSSLGGTQEIAGLDAIVIEEDEWDFVPFDYNVLDVLDFTKKKKNMYDKDISMDYVADKYLEFF